jgi:hypothetical protein
MRLRSTASLLVATLFAAVLGLSCQSGAGSGSAPSGGEASAAARPHDTIAATGTEQMRRVLAAINEEARRHPMDYFHLNQLRADTMKARMEAAPPGKKPQLRYSYAYELLYAGETRAAIEQLTTLIKNQRLSVRRMSQRTKPIFDLLALSYLRLGEQENCVDDYAGQSCILPIRGAGLHTKTEGSENAASLYRQIAHRNRRDLTSRWLLNVAHMTLGDYPEGITNPRFLIPGIEPEEGAEIKTFDNVAARLGVDHRKIAGGTSVADFNGDGFLDILATSYGMDHEMRLYLSDGEGGFVDRTEEAGLSGIVGGLNTVHADYNNDGHVDVLVLRGAWLGENGRHPNSLLRNDGDGTFTDVTFQAGLTGYHPTQTAAWADFNRDGYVDLFIGNESNAQIDLLSGNQTEKDSTVSHPSALYVNDGDGTFTNVAPDVGLDLEAYVKGADWGDVNNDGRPDLYVSVLGGPNRLYVNRGGSSPAEWTFEERAEEAGVQRPFFSFPTWFWDYNNDGHLDIFASGYDMRYLSRVATIMAAEYAGQKTDAERPRVYRNDGDGTFTDVTDRLELDEVMFAMGSNYGDLDNDGYQDFYVGTGAPNFSSIVPNRLFHNQDGRAFDEVTYSSGLGHIQKGHGVAFADFDRDGDQDIYAVIGGAITGDSFRNALFENPGHGNHWITLQLEGRTANRSAIGARVALTVRRPSGETRTIHRAVNTGGSFGSQSLQQEIGLGAATRIDTLRVTWPNADRTTQTFTGLDVDQTLRIVEGKEPVVLDRPPVPFDLQSPAREDSSQPTASRK